MCARGARENNDEPWLGGNELANCCACTKRHCPPPNLLLPLDTAIPIPTFRHGIRCTFGTTMWSLQDLALLPIHQQMASTKEHINVKPKFMASGPTKRYPCLLAMQQSTLPCRSDLWLLLIHSMLSVFNTTFHELSTYGPFSLYRRRNKGNGWGAVA